MEVDRLERTEYEYSSKQQTVDDPEFEVLTPRRIRDLESEMRANCPPGRPRVESISSSPKPPLQLIETLRLSNREFQKYPGPIIKSQGIHKYVVVVEKTHAKEKVGLVVVENSKEELLVITQVVDGLIRKWNFNNPDREVRPGDSVVEVNSEINNRKKLQKIQDDSALMFVLMRPG